MDIIKTPLDELSFTKLCRMGIFTYGQGYMRSELYFTKSDMTRLYNGEIIEKEDGEKKFQFAVIGLEQDIMRRIFRNSSLYQDLYIALQ